MLLTVVRFVAKQICETEDMDSFHEFSEFGDKVWLEFYLKQLTESYCLKLNQSIC